MEGLKFRRQQPIGRYIVDFVCFEKKIIIEVDGGQHAVETKKDTERDGWFRSQGFKVLRFWNNEVLTLYARCFTCLCVARRQGGCKDKLFITPSP